MPVTATSGAITFTKVTLPNNQGWYSQTSSGTYSFEDIAFDSTFANVFIIGTSGTGNSSAMAFSTLNVSNATPTVTNSREFQDTVLAFGRPSHGYSIAYSSTSGFNDPMIGGDMYGVAGNVFPTGIYRGTYGYTINGDVANVPIGKKYSAIPTGNNPDTTFNSFKNMVAGSNNDVICMSLYNEAGASNLTTPYTVAISKILGNTGAISSVKYCNNPDGVFSSNATSANVVTGSVVLDASSNIIFSYKSVGDNGISSVNLGSATYAFVNRWLVEFRSTPTLITGKCAVSPNGYSYITMYDTNLNISYLCQVNDSGGHLWQRQIANTKIKAVVCNGNNEIYIAGTDISTNAMFIARYDSNGEIIFKNKMLSSTGISTVNAILYYNSRIILVGSVASSGFIASLPANGTIPGTGSYGGFLTYSIATNIESESNLIITSFITSLSSIPLFPIGSIGSVANANVAISSVANITLTSTTVS